MPIGKHVKSRKSKGPKRAPPPDVPSPSWSRSDEENRVAVEERGEKDVTLTKEEHLAGLWEVLGIGD